MKATNIKGIIREIESFNNAVFTERINTTKEIIIKFEATKFAAQGITRLFKNEYGMNVLKWKGTNEYFFCITKKIGSGLIKEWYQQNHPTDELGSEIKEDITFNDLFRALENNKDVYAFINVCDSLVRERLFQELANIKKVDYNVVYNLWLNDDKPTVA